MALQNFKDIINNKAYRIQSKDREIFEKGNLQSFFGFSDKDVIEFIVYDANDNQLPQKDWGIVRYIPMTDENIGDYFLIADGTILQAYNFPNEYFIDIERLLNEAGYENGIFKTQINLLNNRVGSSQKFDKLWISEVSPSRTEIRVFPLKRKETEGTDLFERFNIFVKDGEFREDTINSALSIIEKVSPQQVASALSTKYGKNWVDKLRSEYNITNLELFLNNVQSKFVQASLYEFTNRISDPLDLNYGKPKRTKPKLDLSKTNIKQKCVDLYIRALDFYLSRPAFVQNSSFDLDTDSSKDIVGQVLQRTQSDSLIDTTSPTVKVTKVTKPNISSSEIQLKSEIIKELPPPPPPTPVVGPPPPFNPEIGGGNNSGKNYYQIRVTRMGIPATLEQSAFTFINSNGQQETIQYDGYGLVGVYCMLDGSWQNGSYYLYELTQVGLCGPANNNKDLIDVIDYKTPQDTIQKPTEFITPDGLPNVSIVNDTKYVDTVVNNDNYNRNDFMNDRAMADTPNRINEL
jgi:hypothetical protein